MDRALDESKSVLLLVYRFWKTMTMAELWIGGVWAWSCMK